MKIKIIESGWTGFTGQFGEVEFVDGISAEEVTERQAMRLSNLVQIETMDGKNPNAAQQALDSQGTLMSEGMDHRAIAEAVAQKRRVYTREELEQIADDKGIKGLRVIGDAMNIMDRSIAGLISAILAQQAGYNPEQVGLYGSDILPSTFEIDGKTVQLGQIVAEAFKASNLTAEDWNNLPAQVREEKLAEQLKTLKGE